jgi:hypothetical protein
VTIIKYVDKKIQSVSCNTTFLCKHDGASHVDNSSYNCHVIKERAVPDPYFCSWSAVATIRTGLFRDFPQAFWAKAGIMPRNVAYSNTFK